jgi:hypothetical protein
MRTFTVQITLNDSTWHEELKRFIFVDPRNNDQKVIVSETKEISLPGSISSFWRITDSLQEGKLDSVILTIVK